MAVDPAFLYRDPTITTGTVIQGKDASQLGMDDFFNLLVAQLTNQDMMNPTGDTEFIAQMAQFSALQGVKTIQEYQLSSYAAQYIGKFVTIANVTDTGQMETIVGKVDSITYYDGSPKVVVNGKSYDLFAVMEINNEDGSGALAQALKMVGHDATVQTTDEEGNRVELKGEITQAGVSNGRPYVTIGGKHYDTDSILLVDGMTVDKFLESMKDAALNDPTRPIAEENIPKYTLADLEKFKKLLDHNVTIKALKDDNTVSVEIYGLVSDVSLIDEEIFMNVNGKQYQLYQLLEVDGKDASQFFVNNGDTPPANNGDTELPQAWQWFVGRNVYASVKSEYGGRMTVNGVMTDVRRNGDTYSAVINGKYYDDVQLDSVEGKSPANWVSDHENAIDFRDMSDEDFEAFFDRLVGHDVTFTNGNYGNVTSFRRTSGDKPDAYLTLSDEDGNEAGTILYSYLLSVDGMSVEDFFAENPL